MSPRLRKFALTTHVVSSVGWLGAVSVFLALSIAGLTVDDAETVRAAYLAMEVIAWSILIPLALASLVSGLVQGLGTTWGLFRHYWVVVKLVLTLVATAVLLLYTQTLDHMAGLAAAPAAASGNLEGLRSASPAIHAGGALLVLLAAAALSVYKPRGLTRRGWRKQQELRAGTRT